MPRYFMRHHSNYCRPLEGKLHNYLLWKDLEAHLEIICPGLHVLKNQLSSCPNVPGASLGQYFRLQDVCSSLKGQL